MEQSRGIAGRGKMSKEKEFDLNTGARIPSVALGTGMSPPDAVGDAVITAVKVLHPSLFSYLLCPFPWRRRFHGIQFPRLLSFVSSISLHFRFHSLFFFKLTWLGIEMEFLGKLFPLTSNFWGRLDEEKNWIKLCSN